MWNHTTNSAQTKRGKTHEDTAALVWTRTWALKRINKSKTEVAEIKFLWRLAGYIPLLSVNYLKIFNKAGNINDRKSNGTTRFKNEFTQGISRSYDL